MSDAMPAAAYRLPATYADRINVLAGADGMARLTFGGSLPGDLIEWHLAVSMTNANLESLYVTIGEILQRHAKPEGRVQ